MCMCCVHHVWGAVIWYSIIALYLCCIWPLYVLECSQADNGAYTRVDVHIYVNDYTMHVLFHILVTWTIDTFPLVKRSVD